LPPDFYQGIILPDLSAGKRRGLPTLPEMAGSSPAMTETHQPPQGSLPTYVNGWGAWSQPRCLATRFQPGLSSRLLYKDRFMDVRNFDMVVIGAGIAGATAAAHLSGARRVALIEA